MLGTRVLERTEDCTFVSVGEGGDRKIVAKFSKSMRTGEGIFDEEVRIKCEDLACLSHVKHEDLGPHLISPRCTCANIETYSHIAPNIILQAECHKSKDLKLGFGSDMSACFMKS